MPVDRFVGACSRTPRGRFFNGRFDIESLRPSWSSAELQVQGAGREALLVEVVPGVGIGRKLACLEPVAVRVNKAEARRPRRAS